MTKVMLGMLAVCTALVGLGLAFGRLLPSGGELAYVSVRDGNFEVYLLDINSSLSYNLSRHSSRDDTPVWSPDGRQLAFVSYRAGNPQVYTADPATGALEAITSAEWSSMSPAWSPDGEQIAFISNRGGRDGLYAVDSDCLPDCEAGMQVMREQFPRGRRLLGRLSWSPDGRYLAMVINVPTGTSAVHLIEVATGELTRLNNTNLLDTRLGWSADSRRILYSSISDLNTEVYAVDVEDGIAHNLSREGSYDGTPFWSPDGTEVVFESSRDGAVEIYRSRADGSDPQRLTTQGLSRRPIWSPDGGWIVFESEREGSFDIYVMRTDGSGLRRLTASGADDRFPAWRPG